MGGPTCDSPQAGERSLIVMDYGCCWHHLMAIMQEETSLEAGFLAWEY